MKNAHTPDVKALLDLLSGSSASGCVAGKDPFRSASRMVVRETLERALSQSVEMVRSLLRKNGITVRYMNTKIFLGAVRSTRLPLFLRLEVAPMLDTLQRLGQQIKTLDEGGRPARAWMRLEPPPSRKGRRSTRGRLKPRPGARASKPSQTEPAS